MNIADAHRTACSACAIEFLPEKYPNSGTHSWFSLFFCYLYKGNLLLNKILMQT